MRMPTTAPVYVSLTTRYSCLELAAPGSPRAVFLSGTFADADVWRQVAAETHQVLVREHAWAAAVERLGPCLVSLARDVAGRRPATRAEAVGIVQQLVADATTTWARLVRESADAAEAVLDGLLLAAASYLARSADRVKPSWAAASPSETTSTSEHESISLDKGAVFPTRVLAVGSAGVVYAARDAKAVPGSVETLVAKRVYPTQRESALNEAAIAAVVSSPYTLPVRVMYADDTTSDTGSSSREENVWLVLPRVFPTKNHGVDLREFITSGFFQQREHAAHARTIVVQLLRGLEHIARAGVVMRDVKPDNVLVRRVLKATPESGFAAVDTYEAVWTDFGLAVHVGGEDGSSLRSLEKAAQRNNAISAHDVLSWWYDAIKLVPRPKWRFRRPPERAFRMPPHAASSLGAFDLYMAGIIIASIVVGEDLPHLDLPAPKAKLQQVLGCGELPPDYLDTLELGALLRSHRDAFQKACVATFASDAFGKEACSCTLEMLNVDPAVRPTPSNVAMRLELRL